MDKFSIWLEAKQERQIMYHGTSSRLLPKILSEGLQPFPKKRAWQDDPDANFNNPSRMSYGGIYLTKNLLTAVSSAGKVARAEKANQLIICVDIHPYSLIADEDNVTYFVKNLPIPGLLTTEWSLGTVYMAWLILQDKEYMNNFVKKDRRYAVREIRKYKKYIEECKKEYVDSSIKSLLYSLPEERKHPEFIQRLKDILSNEGFEATMLRQVAYIDRYSLIRSAENYNYNKPLPQITKQVGEQKYMNFVDKLSRAAKSTTYASPGRLMNHGRMMKPIGFTGKDKIICIMEIIEKQVDDMRRRDFIKIHYGTPPQQLIEDWKRSQGDWRLIDQSAS